MIKKQFQYKCLILPLTKYIDLEINKLKYTALARGSLSYSMHTPPKMIKTKNNYPDPNNYDYMKVEGWSNDLDEDYSSSFLKALEKKITLPTLQKNVQPKKKKIEVPQQHNFVKNKISRYSDINDNNFQTKQRIEAMTGQRSVNIKIKHQKLKSEERVRHIPLKSAKQKASNIKTEYPFVKLDPKYTGKRKQNEFAQSNKNHEILGKAQSSYVIGNLHKIKSIQDIRNKMKTQNLESPHEISLEKSKNNQGISTLINPHKITLIKDFPHLEKSQTQKQILWNRFNTSPHHKKDQSPQAKKLKLNHNHRSPSNIQTLLEKNRKNLYGKFEKKVPTLKQQKLLLKDGRHLSNHSIKKLNKIDSIFQKNHPTFPHKVQVQSSLKFDDFVDDHLHL